MKKITLIAPIALALLASSNVFAANNYDYTCSSRTEIRLISVEYDNVDSQTPCQVFYSKNGIKKMLWQANQQAGYCESKALEFVNKQINWGFDCQEIDYSAPAEAVIENVAVEEAAPVESVIEDIAVEETAVVENIAVEETAAVEVSINNIPVEGVAAAIEAQVESTPTDASAD